MSVFGRLSIIPWACEYVPDRSVARLGPHSELVTNALRKTIPSRPIRSMFGVLRIVFPASDIASQRWSSHIMITKLGRAGLSCSAEAKGARRQTARRLFRPQDFALGA